MKYKYLNILLYLILPVTLLLTSCDKNFEEINTSSDFVATPTLDLMLPTIELYMQDAGYTTHTDFVAPFVGHVSQLDYYANLLARPQKMGYHFEWIFANGLKSVSDFLDHSKEQADRVNYTSVGRIIKVYMVQTLTDTYGDIPYFDANKGYTDRNYYPKYDPQEKIYADLFKELDESIQAFDTARAITKMDIVYAGSIVKWKKFANSLMLRLGLRIMKADPANGKKWIDKAIAGGLMTSTADNFVVKYQSNTTTASTANPTSSAQGYAFISDPANYRLAQPLVDTLRLLKDPRSYAYAVKSTSTSALVLGDSVRANQRGLPMFGENPVSGAKTTFSTANLNTFARYDAPTTHLSYAEVQLQLAECVIRGIITGTPADATAYYEKGVRASMEQLAAYGTYGVITTAQATAYLQQNPFISTSTSAALRMINTQYWIETFFNWYECFANMRRSGYPDVYVGQPAGIVLPRRLQYPFSEVATNPNLGEAITRQGPDNTMTRMWWDKP